MFLVSFAGRMKGAEMEPTPSTAFSRWLWARMNERLGPEVSQTDIAARMHVPGAVLSAWLNGKSLPGRKNSYKIARYFDVSLEDVYSLVAESEPDRAKQREREAMEVEISAEMQRDIEAALRKHGLTEQEITRILAEYRELRHQHITGTR